MNRFSQISNEKALELLAQYKATKKQTVLGELYAPYMEMVLSIGLKYYKNQTKAEDLVMNIYEKLTDKAANHEISNFYSWLFSMAKNECLMQLRKTKKEFSTDDFSYQANFMESEQVLHLFKDNAKENELNALEHCVEQLKAEQKICIQKFYLNEKTYQDIADETDFELKKVKSHIQNGKRNLKICIEEQHGE